MKHRAYRGHESYGVSAVNSGGPAEGPAALSAAGTVVNVGKVAAHPARGCVREIRYLAYKRSKPGPLGRMGVLEHFYVSAPALMLVTVPDQAAKARIKEDLIDYFRVGTGGAVFEVTPTRHPDHDRTRDVRAAVFGVFNDYLVTHDLVPELSMGGHVQLLLPESREDPIPPLQALARIVVLLGYNSRFISRPLMLVLSGFDQCVLDSDVLVELDGILKSIKSLGFSVVLSLSGKAPNTSLNAFNDLKKCADLEFIAAETSASQSRRMKRILDRDSYVAALKSSGLGRLVSRTLFTRRSAQARTR